MECAFEEQSRVRVGAVEIAVEWLRETSGIGRAAGAEEGCGICAGVGGGFVERDEERLRDGAAVKPGAGFGIGNGGDEVVRMGSQAVAHALPDGVVLRRVTEELARFEQAALALDGLDAVRVALAEAAAELRRRAHAGPRLDEGAEGELVGLAAPVLDPAECGGRGAAVGDGDLGEQDGVVAEGGEDDLVDGVLCAGDALAETADAEDALESGLGGVEGGEGFAAVGEPAQSAGVLGGFRIAVVEEFGSAFVLADADVSVVGGKGDDAIVADLMDVLGGFEDVSGGDVGASFGIGGLVAGIAEGGESVVVFDPLAEVAGAVVIGSGRVWRQASCHGEKARSGERGSERTEHKTPAGEGHGRSPVSDWTSFRSRGA